MTSHLLFTLLFFYLSTPAKQLGCGQLEVKTAILQGLFTYFASISIICFTTQESAYIVVKRFGFLFPTEPAVQMEIFP